MSNLESIARCFGNFGNPIKPNGLCSSCSRGELCKHVTANFVCVEKVRDFITKIEGTMKGE